MFKLIVFILTTLPLDITCMNTTKEIKKNLKRYFKEDQELRKNAFASEQNGLSREEIFTILEIDKLNEKHCTYLKDILAYHGWPTLSCFGPKACQCAWIFVQHSNDRSFQEECLQKMKSLDPHEIDQKFIAYLYDRIQTNAGFPQRYGTQCNNKGETLILEDPENIDLLRSSVGLEPLREYQEKCKNFIKISNDLNFFF